MKVREIMVSNLVWCHPETNLAAATALLWEHKCGILPVVDPDHRPIGVITDRDICIAVGTRGKLAQDITVGQVISGTVFACSLEADIQEALASMQRHHVRRLLVTDHSGCVRGILSIDDVILNVQWSDHKDVALTFADVCRVLRKIIYPGKCSTASIGERANCKACQRCKTNTATVGRDNASDPVSIK
jgi:CBS domain-containing protein